MILPGRNNSHTIPSPISSAKCSLALRDSAMIQSNALETYWFWLNSVRSPVDGLTRHDGPQHFGIAHLFGADGEHVAIN